MSDPLAEAWRIIDDYEGREALKDAIIEEQCEYITILEQLVTEQLDEKYRNKTGFVIVSSD